MIARSLFLLLLIASPAEAQVCLGGTEESAGRIAIAVGRAAEGASLVGGDFAWQLAPSVAVFGDGDVTVYPNPFPHRDRLAIGVAFLIAVTPRVSVCFTPAIETERIDEFHVRRIPLGLAVGWWMPLSGDERRLEMTVEPFFVHSHEWIGGFARQSNFVSGRAGIVRVVRRVLLGAEYEQAFDDDARWHLRARLGVTF